ncbi:MAG: cytochrome c family protein [Leptospiraceae bacterium]|nr:cytochrome c family protein [Leptospiraceae bacterium]
MLLYLDMDQNKIGSRLLLVLLLFYINCNGDSPILSPFSNGKHNIIIGAELTSANDCISCHKTIHKNWKSSQHAHAYTNVLFQHGLEREPRVWCLNCHAPLHTISQELVDLPHKIDIGELAKEGVNCAVCHVRNGKIYGKKENLNLIEHKVYKDSKLMSKELCTSCHNFNFPRTHAPLTTYNENAMQATGDEFTFSFMHIQGKSCQSCHLAKSHILGGASNRDFLKENLKFEIVSSIVNSKHFVKFKISFDKIGHNFPTGDLFRALTLETYDKSLNKLDDYVIHKKLRVIDAYTIDDTRLILKPFTKSLEREVILQSDLKAETCKIVYHYQNPIENQLKGKIPDKEYLFEIYNGKCDYLE